ncbi:MAG: IS21-like element ISBj11 family transposase [Elainellaceae cyanobacterium]
MLQPYQVQVYMRAREQGCTQPQSAIIAGFSERSGRRIESGERSSGLGEERTWRTRPDPLAGVWESELELMLKQEPRLEAMTLYEYLVEKYPGQYEQTLRTVQRRVQAWKALYGDPKEVMFEIRHVPGEMGLSDFTELKDVTITIGGQPFEHLLYHYRLAYSGWQYVQVIQGGESFIGLSEGLQNALFACGGVPKLHRTDSLSAAYRNMAGKRYKPLTQLYDQLCEHYRMRPTRNNTGIAHENGSIESSHGHFKRRLTQQLYLRGSFDFESVTVYQRFIEQVVTTLNGKCVTKYTEEKAHLQPLPRYRVADYEELLVRVSRYSTIEVRCVLYIVPSRLIGQQLTIRLYHDRLVGYLGKQQVVEFARVRGASSGTHRRARCINYRHIIAGLRRKPRAFLYCTWQREILPTEQWRSLWQQIGDTWEPDNAAKIIVEALYIAAT